MRRTRHTSDSRLFFDWLEIAARDLLAARLLLEQGQCLDIAGFHCQQCLEKALKAYLQAGRQVRRLFPPLYPTHGRAQPPVY